MVGFGDEVLILYAPSGVENLGTYGSAANGSYIGGMGTVADRSHNGRRAFSFDGSNDALRGNLASGLGFPRTMAGWFKVSSQINLARLFVVGGSSVATTIAMTTGPSRVAAAGPITSQPFQLLPADEWVLITAVFHTEATVSLRVNDSTSSAGGATTWGQGSLPNNAYSIGARWSEQFCSMLADDIRVLPRALTSTEITDWYTAGRGYGLPYVSHKKRRIVTSYYHQSCS